MGIKHAKNDLLVLTDADCLPASSTGWPKWPVLLKTIQAV